MTERRFSGDLSAAETFWRDHSPWLEERGYHLRPRYRPDWKPSWLNKDPDDRYVFEDAHRAKEPFHLMDALRKSDGLMVMIKKVRLEDPTSPTREMRMNRSLSSGQFPMDDPHNHCIPVYEILELPDDSQVYLFVMPFLRAWWPNWNETPFSTVGEAVAFMQQIFEGTRFLHSRHIAHNDIKHDNVMVDATPLYGHLLHPTVPRRRYDWKGTVSRKSLTRNPVKYYLIDFGSTLEYDPQNGPARELPGYGGDSSVPEFKSHPEEPCDPFAVDVYRLGNLIRRFVMSTQRVWNDGEAKDIRVNPTMDFMSGLVADMTQDDPSKRPSIDQIISRFDEIVKGLSFFKLRSRYWPGYSKESFLVRILWIQPRHFISQLINVLGRYPAIPPTPPPPKGKKRK